MTLVPYKGFLGINQLDDSSRIPPHHLQDAVDATFRSKTIKKRKGPRKLHQSVAPISWYRNSDSIEETSLLGALVIPHTSAMATIFGGASAATSFTLEMNFRTEAIGDAVIFSKLSNGAPRFTFRLRQNAGSFELLMRDQKNATDRTISGSGLSSGVDYHVAIVYASSSGRLELWLGQDGGAVASVGSITEATGMGFEYDATMPICTGQALDLSGSPDTSKSLQMFMSEIRFWAQDRTQTQIDAFAWKGLAPNNRPTIGYYPLDQPSTAVIEDLSGSSNHASLIGLRPGRAPTAIFGNGSYRFSGVNDVVAIPDHSIFDVLESTTATGHGMFTIAFRINQSYRTTNSQRILMRAIDASLGRQFIVLVNGTGTITVSVFDTIFRNVTSTGSFSVGVDTLILVSRDNLKTIRVKVGAAAEENLGTGGSVNQNLAVSTGPLFFGAGFNTSTPLVDDGAFGPFTLDEVALWLGEELDLTELYDGILTNGITDDEIFGDPSLYYRFEESSGSVVKDSSKTGLDGTAYAEEDYLYTVDTTLANLLIRKGRWYRNSSVTAGVAPRILGLYEWIRGPSLSEDDQHILAQVGGLILRFIDGTFYLLKDGLEYSRRVTQFVPFGAFVIIVRDEFAPLEYDGKNVFDLAVQRPATPTLTVIAGGAMTVASFRVAITFSSKDGKRSLHSALSSIATTTTGNKTIKVDWTAPTDPQAVDVDVWVTPANQHKSGVFLRVATVDAIALTYNVTADPIPTARSIDTTLAAVPEIRSAAVHRNRLFSVRTADPREILISPVDQPALVETTYFFDSPITGLFIQRGELIAYTILGKFVLTGVDPGSFSFFPLNSKFGLVERGLLVENRDVHYYLSREGWYVDSYGDQSHVGDRIRNLVLDRDGLDLGSSAYCIETHQAWLSVVRSGESTPDRLVVMNTPRDPSDSAFEVEIYDFSADVLAAVRDSYQDGTCQLWGGWQGFLVRFDLEDNDAARIHGESAPSDLTGVVTSGTTNSVIHNSSAAWPTTGSGLRGCIFRHVTTGNEVRIFSNTATQLTLETNLAATPSTGDAYQIAPIHFSARTRREDFGPEALKTYLEDLFLEIDAQAKGGSVTLGAILEEGQLPNKSKTFTQSATKRSERMILNRTTRNVEVDISAVGPELPCEIFSITFEAKKLPQR